MTAIPKTRWLSLDVFRGLAVLWMIQGHTYTLLARSDEVAAAFGPFYKIGHGLTAPMFLLGGGLAYGFVTLRDGAQPSAARLFRRGLLLILLGYLLHMPRASIAGILGTPLLVKAAAVVGPLQLVGLCLLTCELLRVAFASRSARVWSIGLLALGSSTVAPWVWQARTSLGSPWLGAWLDGNYGSQFPFFPWAAFFYLGVLVAVPVLALQRAGEGERGRNGWLVFGLLTLGATASTFACAMYWNGYVLRAVYGDYDLWRASPLYVLFRTGAVVAILGVLALCEPVFRWLFARVLLFARLFGALARRSLTAYVVHLLLLYGSPFGRGFKVLGKLELSETLAVFAFVLAYTTAVVVLLEHLEKHRTLPTELARLKRFGIAVGARVPYQRALSGLRELPVVPREISAALRPRRRPRTHHALDARTRPQALESSTPAE
jgi:uncharacterized membrane protein